jgi:uncharacterized membrane-anchored protein
MNDLLLYWFLYVSTGAAVGAMIGTLLAFGIRAGSTKLTKWYRSL